MAKSTVPKLILMLSLSLLLFSACGDDDDPMGPSGPKDGAVLISGSGSSTEFDTFEFAVFPFFDWLIITSVKGTDTLFINLFGYQSKAVNSAISLTDTSLLIFGTFGSGKFLTTNFDTLNSVSGSITFTSLDTSGSIAASFSSGAKLVTFSSTLQLSTATIDGDFVATKASGSSVAASISKRMERNRLQKKILTYNSGKVPF